MVKNSYFVPINPPFFMAKPLRDFIKKKADIHRNHKKHTVIVIDGPVGSGKSIQSVPIAWLFSKYFGVPFNINNFSWNVNQYVDHSREAADFSVQILDEGVELHRGSHNTTEFRIIRDLYWTVRSRKQFHIICIMDFHKLPMDIINMVDLLLHCDFEEVEIEDQEGNNVGYDIDYHNIKLYDKKTLYKMWEKGAGIYPDSTCYRIKFTPYKDVLKLFNEEEYEFNKRKYLNEKIDRQIKKLVTNINKVKCSQCDSGEVYRLKDGSLKCRKCGYRGTS